LNNQLSHLFLVFDLRDLNEVVSDFHLKQYYRSSFQSLELLLYTER